MRASVLGAVLALAVCPAWAQGPQDVYGKWLTESGFAHIELGPCADPARGPICGKVVWLKNAINADKTPAPSVEEVRDVLNPNESLRQRRILGLEFLSGFRPSAQEPGTFEQGRIYNAEDGETYSARLRLESPNRLELRGYVLIPLLGKSQIWSRVR